MHDIKQLVSKWYQSELQEAMDRGPAGAIEQAQAAIAVLPDLLAETTIARDEIVEVWFAEHFKKAPISQDTPLYNRVVDAIQILKGRIAAD